MTSSGRRAGLLSLQVLWLHVCLIISPNPLCPPSCPAPQPLSPPRPPVAECDINPEPLGMDCVMSHRLSVSFLKSKHCQFPRTIAPLVLAERRACCMATVGLPPEAPWEKVRVCSWKRIFLSLPLWLLFVSLAAPSLPVVTPSLPLPMPFSPSHLLTPTTGCVENGISLACPSQPSCGHEESQTLVEVHTEAGRVE